MLTFASEDTDDLPLFEVLRKLREDHNVVVSYHRLWATVVAGGAPAHRIGSRLYMKGRDVPLIAQVLRPPSSTAA